MKRKTLELLACSTCQGELSLIDVFHYQLQGSDSCQRRLNKF
jgi:uncharacterized protein YbaR (Trm112 family)